MDHSKAASAAASLFIRDSDLDVEPVGVFSMTVRMPSTMATTVAVMAEHAGQSRNSMLELIIAAGIHSIFEQTPDAIRSDIEQAINEQYENFI